MCAAVQPGGEGDRERVASAHRVDQAWQPRHVDAVLPGRGVDHDRTITSGHREDGARPQQVPCGRAGETEPVQLRVAKGDEVGCLP